ncbi:metallophosphoesterase family protein [Marivirga atlantica]|uniref:Phosphoesterase n=1 Tax=Marivirga atlantica TaxID=1548457 RepID=A0A937DKK9_9BACT|nr:metallophosphoesterase family protein [Marivirga atlantica]MBL0766144.1 metallophosphoesterase family protein [Marivirga atlantica]
MKIGLISDTHGHLEASVAKYFKNCDEIWHAGDIGEGNIMESLSEIAPVQAVFGNIDTPAVQKQYSEDLILEREGKKILMTHIAGKPPRYNPRVKKLIKELKPDIFICGHSHILRVIPDKENNCLYINPGAAGKQGFHREKTIIRFDINSGKIENMEVIELGKRGAS